MIAIIVTAWLSVGVALLFFTAWCLASMGSKARIGYLSALRIVVFWPDFTVSLIKFVRSQTDEVES